MTLTRPVPSRPPPAPAPARSRPPTRVSPSRHRRRLAATPAPCSPSCSCATPACSLDADELRAPRRHAGHGASAARCAPTSGSARRRGRRRRRGLRVHATRRGGAGVVKRLLDDGARVIDLSADFRLDADAYASWYGEHPHPELLPGGVRPHRAAPRRRSPRRRWSPTPAATRRRRCSRWRRWRSWACVDVVIDAKSGVSGAGKTPRERPTSAPSTRDLVAYGLQRTGTTPRSPPGSPAAARRLGSAPGQFGARGAAAPAPSADLRAASRAAPARHQRDDLRAPGHAAAPAADSSRRCTHEFYAGETFVEVCDAPPAAQGRGRHQLLPHPRARRRAGRRASSSSA